MKIYVTKENYINTSRSRKKTNNKRIDNGDTVAWYDAMFTVKMVV